MPQIKSAKKRVLVSATKTLRNKSIKSNLKTVLKQAHAALETNAENKEELVLYALKRIDQAAAKGIMHKNTAAHKKSELALKLNASNR